MTIESSGLHLWPRVAALGAVRHAFAAVVASAALLLGASGLARADTGSSDWRFGLMVYGWLPRVSGTLRYDLPLGLGGAEIDVSTRDVLDALEMTFMTSFEARRGGWSAFTDVIYLDLQGAKSKSVALPSGAATIPLDADLQLTGWVWTLGGGYSLWRDAGSHLDLIAGGRLLAIDTDLTLTGGGPLGLRRKVSKSADLLDGIVGVSGRLALSDRWFVPYYADIGTGGSDVTWQAAGGVGYGFGWGDVMLLYRHLEYDQGSDKLIQDVALSGGMLGVNFRF